MQLIPKESQLDSSPHPLPRFFLRSPRKYATGKMPQDSSYWISEMRPSKLGDNFFRCCRGSKKQERGKGFCLLLSPTPPYADLLPSLLLFLLLTDFSGQQWRPLIAAVQLQQGRRQAIMDQGTESGSPWDKQQGLPIGIATTCITFQRLLFLSDTTGRSNWLLGKALFSLATKAKVAMESQSTP